MPEFQNWWVVIKETFYKVSIPLLQPWNKQICLFKPFVSLLLSYPLVCLILIFYFKTLIQISFLIFTAKLMHAISILLLNYLTKMLISLFSLHFFHQNTLLRVQTKFFSRTLKSRLLFSWWRKVWKATITIYFRLITDSFPSYLSSIFCSLESFELNFWIP